MGGDYFALCLALEELARVDSSVAITLEAAVSLGAMPIYRFGTEEQKRDLAAAAAQRRGAGRVRPHRAGLRLGRRRHRRPGRCWTATSGSSTASKAFITNSGTDITALVTVTAVTGHERRTARKEISTIIVPTGTPGLHRRARLLQGRLVRLGHPRADLRRLPGAGGEPARRARPRLRPVPADPRRGPDRDRRAGRRAGPGLRRRVGASTPSERHAFGRPIGDYQAIQFKIADMEMRAHTARLAYYDAAARMLRRRAVQAAGRDRQAARQRDRGGPTPARPPRSTAATAS